MLMAVYSIWLKDSDVGEAALERSFISANAVNSDIWWFLDLLAAF